MTRYPSVCTVAVSCLAMAMFALTIPDSGAAAAHHASRSSPSRRPERHRRGSERRRHTHNAKGTSAAHATKKAEAKSGHLSNPTPTTPTAQPTRRVQTSPVSESFPDELLPVRPQTPEEPAESPAPAPPAEPPASKEPVKTPAPKEPAKLSAPEEPVKSPPSEEHTKTSGSEEHTTTTPEEPAKSPSSEEPAGKEPTKTSAPEEPETKESPPEKPAPAQRKLIWSDEFSGPAGTSPGSQWQFDTGGDGWGNEELETYTSRAVNAELNGQGQLAIAARAEKYTGTDGIARAYTSARLQTFNTFKFQYGLVEARIQVPVGQGLVAQFWMLGQEAYEQENWPACGEIDTMEVLGSEPNVVNGTLHAPWAWAPTGEQGQDISPTPLSGGFHTYSVEWEPERISFMLDGSVYKTITPADLPAGAAWPFKHPFSLLMDLAVGGEWPGSPNTSTKFPAQMLVDWVRVWQ
jgi:beta-glucanase (GH16 family)